MRGGVLSLLGLGFLALALWRAFRVRRDLASGQTCWDPALFGRGTPIRYVEAPLRFWCAIAINTAVVLLFTLVAAVALRAIALARL